MIFIILVLIYAICACLVYWGLFYYYCRNFALGKTKTRNFRREVDQEGIVLCSLFWPCIIALSPIIIPILFCYHISENIKNKFNITDD